MNTAYTDTEIAITEIIDAYALTLIDGDESPAEQKEISRKIDAYTARLGDMKRSEVGRHLAIARVSRTR